MQEQFFELFYRIRYSRVVAQIPEEHGAVKNEIKNNFAGHEAMKYEVECWNLNENEVRNFFDISQEAVRKSRIVLLTHP